MMKKALNKCLFYISSEGMSNTYFLPDATRLKAYRKDGINL